MTRLQCYGLVVASLLFLTPALTVAQTASRPTLKFFFYNSRSVEWFVSAEPARLERHLAENGESESLFRSIQEVIHGEEQAEAARTRMADWIGEHRQDFQQRSAVLFRKAEGIIAYLRAHDFSSSNLVEALKKRSGAADVELVAIHLVDADGGSSFKLKVVLVDPTIDVGRQGYNVDLASPEVSYVSVVYALGVALYEVHELLNDSESLEREEDATGITLEPLPVPATKVNAAETDADGSLELD